MLNEDVKFSPQNNKLKQHQVLIQSVNTIYTTYLLTTYKRKIRKEENGVRLLLPLYCPI